VTSEETRERVTDGLDAALSQCANHLSFSVKSGCSRSEREFAARVLEISYCDTDERSGSTTRANSKSVSFVMHFGVNTS